MASSSHPSFPSRPYAGNLGKLPDRSLGGATFGASTTQQQRENARLERERERLEKERLEREEQNQLTEEQREEIKEAVCLPPPPRPSFSLPTLLALLWGNGMGWIRNRKTWGREEG